MKNMDAIPILVAVSKFAKFSKFPQKSHPSFSCWIMYDRSMIRQPWNLVETTGTSVLSLFLTSLSQCLTGLLFSFIHFKTEKRQKKRQKSSPHNKSLLPTIQLRKFIKPPVFISRSTHFTILLYDILQMLAVAFKVDLESLL